MNLYILYLLPHTLAFSIPFQSNPDFRTQP